MQMSVAGRRQATSVRSLAIAADALGVSIYASVIGAHGGTRASERVFAAAGGCSMQKLELHRVSARQAASFADSGD